MRCSLEEFQIPWLNLNANLLICLQAMTVKFNGPQTSIEAMLGNQVLDSGLPSTKVVFRVHAVHMQMMNMLQHLLMGCEANLSSAPWQ